MSTLKDFNAFHKTYNQTIESYLENSIKRHIPDKRQILLDAVRHSLLNGGKRVRPLLTIASALLFSDSVKDFIPLACAFEIIHTYSLIHDDLPCMDDDDLRRGKPTCHVKFGEDIAILSGDTLNTLAFEILSTKLNSFDPQQLLKLIGKIANQMGVDGLVGGQVLDICSQDDKEKSIEKLRLLHQKKTGTLIELSIISPALLTSAKSEVINELSRFAKHLGLLFQIIDDVLDVTGNKETLGKSPGKDLKLNKLTYPTFLSLEITLQLVNSEKNACLTCLENLRNSFNFNTMYLESIVEFIANRQH